MRNESGLCQDVARDARLYLASELSWDQFIGRYSESTDNDVAELVDLIEHEPARGGFLGVSEEYWSSYRQQIETLLRRLEASVE